MGEILQKFSVRTGGRGKGRKLSLCFDTGSLHSFVKDSTAGKLGHIHELGEPKRFGGLGNGRFLARQDIYFEVRLLGSWCSHFAYVVPEMDLGVGYDMLIGHGFMQGFNVRCDPRNRRVVLDRGSLRRAQMIHHGYER